MSSAALLSGQCASQSLGPLNTLVNTLLQALLTAQCAISAPEYWPPDYAVQALQRGLDTYDFVVVGAGSAGSVMGSRLSENPNWRVLVLEAGGDPPQESEVPNVFFTVQHTNATWNYFTEPSDIACLAMRDRRCYWPRGKMIGGSSGANAMLYVRGNRRDYDTWLHNGNVDWGWDDVLPYFERSIRAVGNATHPQGYLTVNEFEPDAVHVENMIYAGAAQVGVSHVRRFEEGSDLGYSKLLGTVANGRRTSSGKGYLARVAQRSNLHVIKQAQVTHINFDESGTSVESLDFMLRNKEKLNVQIGKELVLSAGAIDTPKLLLLSGVGPADQLKHFGIPVIHELPVGENLQDHVNTVSFLKLNENAAPLVSTQQTLDNIYNYLIHSRGPLATHAVTSVTGFINTLRNGPYPDIEQHHLFFPRGDVNGIRTFVNGLTVSDEYAQQIIKAIDTADLLGIFTVLLNPKSAGNLRLRSNDYKDPPVLTHNYLTESDDVETMVRGLKHLKALEQTAAYGNMGTSFLHINIEECDKLTLWSDDYWRCYAKYFTSTTYHQTGTVKMGPDTDPTSCVNPRLRLRGVSNLRVVDASIMPLVPSANTNAPTIMIAERATDFMREDWKEDAPGY